jgi:hypothetical protein
MAHDRDDDCVRAMRRTMTCNEDVSTWLTQNQTDALPARGIVLLMHARAPQHGY